MAGNAGFLGISLFHFKSEGPLHTSYSDPTFIALIFLFGTAVGALFNSLYRTAMIRKLKHEFIQEILRELQAGKPTDEALTSAPLHWTKQTSETAKAAVRASQQVDSIVQDKQTAAQEDRRTAS